MTKQITLNIENVTITGNVLTTTLTDEQVREARGEWPRLGSKYSYLNTTGAVYLIDWLDDDVDRERLDIGNVYRTEAEATRERDIRLAMQRVRTWIRDNGMEFVSDWDNTHQAKWSICFFRDTRVLNATVDYFSQRVTANLYFATDRHAQACIDACNDDLRIIAGVA